MPVTKDEIKELAERIYDLDAEVYSHLGSSLGRVFNRDRERCVNDLIDLLLDRSKGNVVRSELVLIANMARTIEDKEERSLCMTAYDNILKDVMSLQTSFGSGDVVDTRLADLNTFNLKDRFKGDKHLIICISWAYGSGGINVGFKLSDKLKINFYDDQIFAAVTKRLDAEKDHMFQDAAGYQEAKQDYDQDENLASAYGKAKRKTLHEYIRDFSRYHGLSRRDAAFFNQSDLMCEMAKKEDFIIMGRCGNVVMTNNNIPHISIYITAPFEKRIERAMEINPKLDRKGAIKLLKSLDRKHKSYYSFFTGGEWGNANNYDLCINTASYGIDGTVDFILRMIDWDK